MALDLNRLRGAVTRIQGGGPHDPGPPPEPPLGPPPAPSRPSAVAPDAAAGESGFIPTWLAVFLLALVAFSFYRFQGTGGPPTGEDLQSTLSWWFYSITYYPLSAGWQAASRLWAALMTLSRFTIANFAVALLVVGFVLWVAYQLLRWLASDGAWVLWLLYVFPAIALAGLWGWNQVVGGPGDAGVSTAASPPAAEKVRKPAVPPESPPARAPAQPAAPSARELEKGSAERKELIDFVRPMIEKMLHPPVTFEVEAIRRAGDYAYLRMTPIRPTGEPIDVQATNLKNKSVGVLTEIVLQREAGSWKLVEGTVGAPAGWAQRFCEPPHPRDLTGACP